MVVTLRNGRAHENIRRGGDFREATYRAIRHALHLTECAAGAIRRVYAVQDRASGRHGGICSACTHRFAPQMLPQWAELAAARDRVSNADGLWGSDKYLAYTGGTGGGPASF